MREKPVPTFDGAVKEEQKMRTIKIGGSPGQINRMLNNYRQRRLNDNTKKEYINLENKDGKCSVEIMEEYEIAYDTELDFKAELMLEN